MRMFHTVSARENIPIMVVQDIMGNFCLAPTAMPAQGLTLETICMLEPGGEHQ